MSVIEFIVTAILIKVKATYLIEQMNFDLIMIIQAVVLPLILGVVCFTSYHLLMSVAFAVCFIPKSS